MNKKLTKIVDDLIDLQSNSLSQDVSAKLSKSRQEALQVKKNAHFFISAWYVPVAATAVFALYFIFTDFNVVNKPQTVISEDYAIIQQMELADDFDLVEDLDFYQWLSYEADFTSI